MKYGGMWANRERPVDHASSASSVTTRNLTKVVSRCLYPSEIKLQQGRTRSSDFAGYYAYFTKDAALLS